MITISSIATNARVYGRYHRGIAVRHVSQYSVQFVESYANAQFHNATWKGGISINIDFKRNRSPFLWMVYAGGGNHVGQVLRKHANFMQNVFSVTITTMLNSRRPTKPADLIGVLYS